MSSAKTATMCSPRRTARTLPLPPGGVNNVLAHSNHATRPENEKNPPKRRVLSVWARQDSNLRRQSHQIYSLTRLSTSVHAR